ncbi:MAG: MFS transporter [Tannerella sp.]|jgi:EmrB/QacA subfamily drug resistance transporter|nr:MFS transporter [Tannerella sp.]
MKYKYKILIVICLSVALVPFTSNSINLALKDIATDLSMNAVSLSWVITILMVPSAVLQIPFGKAGDIFGRKKLLLTGVILFSLASFCCLFVKTGNLLLVMRFVQGVASAMLFGVSAAIITNVFSREERGKAIGIQTATVYFALSAGPVLGGMLTHNFGWRSIFLVTAFLGVLAFTGIILFMKEEWKEEKPAKFDWWGMLVYTVAIVGILWGFSSLPEIKGFVATAIGLTALLLFVYYEKKQTFPMFDMNMFLSNRVFRMSLFAALINYAATFAISFLLSLYLQYVKGFDPQKAGWILLAQPIAMMLLSPVAGRWSDKIDAGKIATLGMAIIAVCLVILLFLTPQTPVYLLIIVLLILGSGFALFSSPNMNVIMGSVKKQFIGTASATAGTMRLVGQAFSMGITMMMISMFIGQSQITTAVYPQLMKCLRITFVIFMVLCCFGVYFSMVRKEKE